MLIFIATTCWFLQIRNSSYQSLSMCTSMQGKLPFARGFIVAPRISAFIIVFLGFGSTNLNFCFCLRHFLNRASFLSALIWGIARSNRYSASY